MNARVLGKFTPSQLGEYVLRAELSHWLKARGQLATLVEVRKPSYLITLDDTAYRWHKDGYYSEALTAVWSNVLPTEVRLPCEKLTLFLPAKAGEVILIDSLEVQHRAPRAAFDAKNRWFVRAWLAR